MSGDNNVTISSTTSPQSELDAAIAHDAKCEGNETPASDPVSLHIASTTNSRDEVVEVYREFKDKYPARPVDPMPRPEEPPPRMVSTDGKQEDAKVERELREDQRSEGRAYLGRSRSRKRIAQLVGERNMAEGEVFLARSENAQLRQEVAAIRQQQQHTGQQGSPQQPQLNQEQLQQLQLQLTANERRHVAGEAAFPYRLQEARQKHANWDELVAKGADVHLPVEMVQDLRHTDGGLGIAVHLVNETAKQITERYFAGDQKAAYDMLDQIHNGLRFQAQNPQPAHEGQRRGLPPPLRPVGGSSMASSTGGYNENMSMKDYNAWRNAVAARGRRRR